MKFNTLSILEKIEVKRYIFDLVENGAEDEFDEIFDDFVKLTNIDRDDAAELFNKELEKVYDDIVVGDDYKNINIPKDIKTYKNITELLNQLDFSFIRYEVDQFTNTIKCGSDGGYYGKQQEFKMVKIDKTGQFYLEEIL